MKSPIALSLVFVLTGAAHAATSITETFTNITSSVIPDGDLNGLVQSLTPATTIGSVSQITVNLNVSGGWAGDLYAYLWHGGEISVLVNRPGVTLSNPSGSGATGLAVLLSADGATDIHSAPGSFGTPLVGTFQPDGRNLHPFNVLDTTPRTALLSVFNTAPAAGEYRLFIADVATGETATLTSWSVSITGEAIPEPSSALLLGLGTFALLRRRR